MKFAKFSIEKLTMLSTLGLNMTMRNHFSSKVTNSHLIGSIIRKYQWRFLIEDSGPLALSINRSLVQEINNSHDEVPEKFNSISLFQLFLQKN